LFFYNFSDGKAQNPNLSDKAVLSRLTVQLFFPYLSDGQLFFVYFFILRQSSYFLVSLTVKLFFQYLSDGKNLFLYFSDGKAVLSLFL
jgi:hypothetical protein